MPYMLSPEQKVVSDTICTQNTSDIKFFDINTAFQAIEDAIIKCLLEGKKVLVHIPEEDESAVLFKHHIHNSGLEELAIDIGSRNPVPETDIIKLRTALKKNVDTDCIVENQLSKRRLVPLRQKVSCYYQALSQTVLSDIPFSDFSNSLIYNKKLNDNITISGAESLKLEFTPSEYYSIKKFLNQAASLYKTEYDLYDHLPLLNESLWSLSTEKLNEKRNHLQSLNESVKSIIQNFQLTNESLIEDAGSSTSQLVQELEDTIHHAEEACIKHHIAEKYGQLKEDKTFKIFGSKKKPLTNQVYVDTFESITTIIRSISNEWSEKTSRPTNDTIDYEFIINFISIVKKELPKYKNENREHLLNSIQRINRINTSSPEVIQLDGQLNAIIDTLEKNDLFLVKFGQNTISFSKQYEQARQIGDYLDKCSILIGATGGFSEWKAFYNTTNQTFKLFFSEIKNQQRTSWEPMFDDWYFDQIKVQTLNQNAINEEVMTQLFQAEKNVINSEIPALISSLNKSRVESSTLLKQTSKELYNTLFKKKSLPTTSWHDISLMSRTFMKGFFPIHINARQTAISEYDLVISLTRRPEIMEDELSIHYLSPIQTEDIEEGQNGKNLFLYLNHYNYDAKIQELRSSEKLKASKKLAKYILSLNQDVKIYQMKSANIISLLPMTDDHHLEANLDSYGTKTIDTTESLYEKLTECILFTERQPYLIIKDQLINPKLSNHLQWQQYLSSVFEKAGYKILSVNTSDQLEDNHKVFSDIISELTKGAASERVVENQKPEVTAQNQLAKADD